ncbi:MAG TPA: biotin--[acetyl-CoA-carboxylase] ligase [Thermomicrobiales bacterium]|nr:biotin--[acetyl-CoA-carboxylase] ligase [Thermomicrobiales bacterium]
MLGEPLIRRDVVASTMDMLARLAAAGAPEGTTVVAEYQTAGRGRAGRQWVAPPGTALLHSVLLRPKLAVQRLTPLAILVADAVVTTLEERYGLTARIKWPNDVLLNGQKVSGVLIQTRTFPGDAHPAVLVGVGINANVPVADLPEGGTSLLVATGQPVDRDDLMRAFLARLDVRYQELLAGDQADRVPAIQDRLAMRGEQVSIVDGGTTVTGRLCGIDASGALLLDTGEADLRRIVVGDLTRGPRVV